MYITGKVKYMNWKKFKNIASSHDGIDKLLKISYIK